ncbi:hypothetical protein HHK36_015657 [Tetracentron sinense]|uniref:NAC domain-containing protein n=1 Tax=Tetracentron sinense TaxID=13715 RepID=A0A834ZC66_TETSI|nr:hypothetical protein HHK36_015657 [Tetracentron sinense]
MARTWLLNSRGIARKVKNATQFPTYQIKDCGASRECPNCHYRIDNSDVSLEWPGFPAGVKFDPSDVELLEHLAGKARVGNSKPHMFIDEFILTLEGDEGICYTHPENLPGAKKDGSSVHFFHRTTNAYTTGHRKRRKIHGQCSLTEEHVRWHKTGRTKPVIDNGVKKGCKKIMVLYKSSKKGSKPDKSNWVMHQYHLGTEEDEREGECVVSKVFYQQQKQTDKRDSDTVIEESDTVTLRPSPRTPKTKTPDPPRSGKRVLYNDANEDNVGHSSAQEAAFISGEPQPSLSAVNLEDDRAYPAWWAGESQAIENPDPDGVDDSLLCNEIFDSSAPLNNSGLKPFPYFTDFGCSTSDTLGGDTNTACGITDLDNIELETPPDFQLADLQFGSQDSIIGWLDCL